MKRSFYEKIPKLPDSLLMRLPIFLIGVYIVISIGASFYIFSKTSVKFAWANNNGDWVRAGAISKPNRGELALNNWVRKNLTSILSANYKEDDRDSQWDKFLTMFTKKSATNLWMQLDSVNMWNAIFENEGYSEPTIGNPVITNINRRKKTFIVQVPVMLSVRNATSATNTSLIVQLALVEQTKGNAFKGYGVWTDAKK